MSALVDPRFGAAMRTLLEERGVSYRALAALTHYGKSYLHDLAAGKKAPSPETAHRIDEALNAGGQLVAVVHAAVPLPAAAGQDDEIEALELSRRIDASDVSAETLARLEQAVDDLATAYATAPPEVLLPRARRYLGYVTRLVDARKTIDQQRRLLVAGGWLSLLAATLDIDLRQHGPAAARLGTAWHLGRHAGHAEILAWCLETRAWDALTDGDYPRAVTLSQQAQAVAPRGSSARIQAAAQEGRAWARMGRKAETHDALDRVARLVAPLPQPERPEHHYQYDPAKALAYTATTLAWAGDPGAEEYAREVLRQLEAATDGVCRPRRVASARLDLGVALIAAGRPDEAAAQALTAITSGRIVPSNWWRANELVTGVQRAGLLQSAELLDALRTYCRPPSQADGSGQLPPSM